MWECILFRNGVFPPNTVRIPQLFAVGSTVSVRVFSTQFHGPCLRKDLKKKRLFYIHCISFFLSVLFDCKYTCTCRSLSKLITRYNLISSMYMYLSNDFYNSPLLCTKPFFERKLIWSKSGHYLAVLLTRETCSTCRFGKENAVPRVL